MKSFSERHAGWPLVIGITTGVLAITAGPALAALTFSGTSISGDGAVVIESSSTISIGTSTATTVTIGNASSQVQIGPDESVLPPLLQGYTGAADLFTGSIPHKNVVGIESSGDFNADMYAAHVGDGIAVAIDDYAGKDGDNPVALAIDANPHGFAADTMTALYIYQPTLSGGSATTSYGIWVEDQTGATNPYYSWFNSQGVRRVKEDKTFNGVGQAIEALYNPQFTQYTPGAEDYERIVLGEWNSNVAEIGTENGGTGSARALAFITSSTARMTIGSTGNVGIGTGAPSTTLQVASASSTIRIGNSALPGCLEMGNSDGSAGINYITDLNGLLTSTTTKPSNCQ